LNILDNIKVLALSQFLSGPGNTKLLAFSGAEEVKLEPPAGDSIQASCGTWACPTKSCEKGIQGLSLPP
jgi:crotonobetainyl-CoA:carnitine CoA-transferase CaiB-like acyl-CoA transferase